MSVWLVRRKEKIGKRGRKRVKGLVKCVGAKRELSERGREVVEFMAEHITELKRGERGREMVHRVIEHKAQVEEGERGGKVVNRLV